MLGVACLIEEIGAEDEIPRRRPQQRLGFAPANAGHPEEDAVALGVPPQQLDRFLGPVRREHLGASHRCSERRQSQAAPELDDPQPGQLSPRHVTGQSDTAGPELRPVGQKLLLVECRLVDQLLGAGRPEDVQA